MNDDNRVDRAFREMAGREEVVENYRCDPTSTNRQKVVGAFGAWVEWGLCGRGVPWAEVSVLSSEVLDEVLDNIQGWHPARRSFHGYLGWLVERRAATAAGVARNRSRILEDYGKTREFQDNKTGEVLSLQKEEAERVWTAVRSLPPEMRMVILLVIVDGMSRREIARQMGASLSRIVQLYDRGIVTLRKQLGE